MDPAISFRKNVPGDICNFVQLIRFVACDISGKCHIRKSVTCNYICKTNFYRDFPPRGCDLFQIKAEAPTFKNEITSASEMYNGNKNFETRKCFKKKKEEV